MITGIQHVAIVTSDVERARRFYVDILGFNETLRLETSHSGTIIFLSLGGTELELFGGGSPRVTGETGNVVGFRHLALSVDDVDEEYERLKSLGVKFDMPPTSAESGIRLAFFQDPDGSPIEIIKMP